MPGPVTDATLLDALKSALAKTDPLAAFWGTIVSRANTRAYWTVVGAMVGRGYLLAQITAWDRLEEFQLDLGLWWCMTLGKAKDTGDYDWTALQAMDRRKELTGDEREGIVAVALTIDGVWQDPLGTINQPVTGPFDADEDLFGTPIDPEDPRLGEVVEF